MANVIRTVIQLRRATTAEWLANKDIIPAAGEPCFDTELYTLKIGDGEKTYENLPVIGGGEDVTVAADGKSIVMTDGVFSLAGFEAAEVGAQPRVNAEGSIEWIVPSTETVEGLQSTVAGLQSDVTNLQTNVTNIQEIVMPSEDGGETLLVRVESLEEKMDGTGEGSVDAKIDAKIEAFATNLTEDGKVNTLMELINYVETHGEEAADMAADIQSLQDYMNGVVKEVSVGGALLDVVDGKVEIPVGAGLKTSEEIVVNEDGTLSVGTISFSKIVQTEDEVVVFDGGSAANYN